MLNEPKARMSIILTNRKDALNGLFRDYNEEGDLRHH